MKLRSLGTAAAITISAATMVFAPAAAAAMHGDPDNGSANWSEQAYDDCGIMAAAHLIGFFTGDTPAEEDIVAVSAATPSQDHPGSIYMKPTNLDDPNTGQGSVTTDLPVLMAHYGVNGTYTDDDVADDGGLATGMSALEHYLDIGGAVLAIADADLLWNEPGAEYGAHAVVVTGIDTDQGIVHLNDSGPDDGADEQVRIDQFSKAWEMYGHQLVVVTE
jgi:Peptidase_C39 like family